MPGSWIFALICFAVAGLALLVAVGGGFFKAVEVAVLAGIITIIAGVIGGISTLAAAYDRVDTRNVGIATAFGRPVGTHEAGIWWHAPWIQVHELSETIQLQAFESTSYDDASKGTGENNNPAALLVRLANNSTAYVNVNLNWRLKEGAAGKLFQDYGGSSNADVFNTIKQQLVDRQAQTMVSRVFSGFNPQSTVAGQDPSQVSLVVPDLPGYADKVKADLQQAVGSEIEIIDVKIRGIFYDKATQDRIDDYNKKVQETKNAQQDALTAKQRKEANDTIASSVSNPLVIVAQCVDSMVKSNKDPGQCYGPMGGIGGQNGGVLVTVPKPGA